MDRTKLTIDLPDDLMEAIDRFRDAQQIKPTRTATIVFALQDWLNMQEIKNGH